MLPSGAAEHRLPFKLGSPLKNGLIPPVSNTYGTDMNNEEVRTLFVSGLPMDVRLRELYLLFRCYEGYEGSFLKLISSKPGKPPQPIAFVSFTSRPLAERALEELQGIRFDPSSSQTLRLEFARTNSRVSPKQQQTQVQQQQQQQQQQHIASHVQPPLVVPPQANPPVYYQSYPTGVNKDGVYTLYCLPPSSPTTYAMASPGPSAAVHQPQQNLFGMGENSGWSHRMLPLNYHQSLTHVSTPSPTLSPAPSTPHLSVLNILSDSDSSYNSPSHTPTQALDNYLYYPPVPSSSSPIPSDYTKEQNQPFPVHIAMPCPTLFVANLEPHCTEEEITDLFVSCEGFTKAKLLCRGGPPVAFVEFQDVECAGNAMATFQGHILPSSKRLSGIRIEYARQRMGEPQTKSPIPSEESSEATSPIQSLTSAAANLSIAHSPNASVPIINPSLTSDPNSVITSNELPLSEPIPQSPPFHLNLQSRQPTMPVPLRADQYQAQQASMSLPAFPIQQGMDPNPPSFSLPRQSPVQSISSLVTQNLSASGGGSPQRPEFGSLLPQNNRMMYGGAQGYGGMARNTGPMIPPGSIGINPHGQMFVNGYVQGMPHSWPYNKQGFQPHMQ